MRLFFSQKDQPILEELFLKASEYIADDYKIWFSKISQFAIDHNSYYYDKYENNISGEKPYKKYLNQILTIPINSSHFFYLFEEASENTNSFLERSNSETSQKWSDALLFNPQGEANISFARFAIQFSMLKAYYKSISLQLETI